MQRQQATQKGRHKWKGWRSEWVDLTPEQVKKLRGSAIRFAHRHGHGWIADELASHAVIETAQGNKVNFKWLLVDLLKNWCGRRGSARNETMGFEEAGIEGKT